MFEKNLPEVVSPEEWLAARKELLVKEKELTRARDRVNADRRRLPMVRVDKPYTFEGPDVGPARPVRGLAAAGEHPSCESKISTPTVPTIPVTPAARAALTPPTASAI